MRKLTIDNFGPIKHAEIDINKYNILIGPQSAGKSCIMKVLAFCRTVENMLIQGKKDNLDFLEFTNNYFYGYYNTLEYSFYHPTINYESAEWDIKITLDCFIEAKLEYTKKGNKSERAQIVYIPTERSVISAIPNLLDLKFPNNNNTCLAKYISDWGYAHQEISSNNAMRIPGTNLSYYFDSKENSDKIKIDDKNVISLSCSSSGVQSLVPICTILNYYITHTSKTLGEKNKVEELKNMLDFMKGVSVSDDVIQKMKDEMERIKSEISPCEFLIEEPEINLFPETQYELVKWIIKTLNSNKNENSLFMATHSPYILTSINNLIQAGNSVAANPEARDKIIEMMGTDKFINYDEISVYSIGNGTAKSIKNDELKLIDSNDIDSVSDRISEEFSKLLDYEG